ncbi:MAG: hypothetical protein M3Y17_07870 [Actinomycetota bacterium]|nr:hypothetical protein [Actinomycetota bacterium]
MSTETEPMTAQPLIPSHAHLPALLERALDGLACGASDAERQAALSLLGHGDDADDELLELLFCACWNALWIFGLRDEAIAPERADDDMAEPS